MIDTFTPLECAIAVLYVITLLLTAGTLTPGGILAVGLAGSGLSVVSFGVTHGVQPTLPDVMRLGVAIAVITITTTILIRERKARLRLVATHRALARSEWRYRSIFKRSRVSLWEQDYSKAIGILDGLKAAGVTDLVAHDAKNPGFLESVTGAVLTTEVNEAMVEVLGASTRSQAFAPLVALKPDTSTMLGILQAIYDGKDHYEGQGTLVGFDGRQRVVLVAKAFPPDIARGGRVVGTLVDVTHREHAREARCELARASHAATVGALSASIAHELNQPLGAVVMNAQTCLVWLRKSQPNIDRAVAAAERAAAAGLRAGEIVRKVSALLTKGARNDEQLELHQLVLGVVGLLEREINEHGATIRMDIGNGIPPITADRVALQQVLVNLVSNALHAVAGCGRESREIDIGLDQLDMNRVRLRVRDRGPGIASENMARLFEPFFTTKEGGMGMGLAISRMAVEAGGGQLTADNHEDGGAVFECILPIRSVAQA